MKHRKKITIFLIDGEPSGRLTCELSNWTGKAYRIPRTKVKTCSDRPELTSPGVYLLFGKNEAGKDLVYIGEAESIFKRLTQQLTQQDFWNEAIAFISKDENLNKAHVKYLENRLYEIAGAVNRYQLKNSSTPTLSSISEADRAEMEEFIDNAKILVNTLSHKVFEDKREEKAPEQQARETFFIKATRGADAQGEPSPDGFIVFKDSKVATSTVPSMTQGFLRLRKELLESGVILPKDDKLILVDDYIFSSPSTAAVIVLGRNANGLTEWKRKDGTTLKEFESRE